MDFGASISPRIDSLDWPPNYDAQDGRHVDPNIENNDGEDARGVAYGYENGRHIVAHTFGFGTMGYSEWTVWYAWYLPKLPNSALPSKI